MKTHIMFKTNLSRLFLGLACLVAIGLSNSYAGVIYDKNFQGEEQEIGVLLSWSTVTEENNSLFIIEKASDGEEYELSLIHI